MAVPILKAYLFLELVLFYANHLNGFMRSILYSCWLELEQSKKEFLAPVLSASTVQQLFKPEPEAWNMLQVLQHVVATEKVSIAYLLNKSLSKKRNKEGIPDKFRALFLRVMLKSPLKFKVPEVKGVTLTQDGGVEELKQEWSQIRLQLKSFLEEFPEDRINELIFRHPVAGWISIRQTLFFFKDHVRHHQQQLKRIKNNPEFPG